jgi:hypothetical protein
MQSLTQLAKPRNLLLSIDLKAGYHLINVQWHYLEF